VPENRKTWGAEEKDAQDCILGNFQPSPAGLFDWAGLTQDLRPGLLSAVPSGLVPIQRDG
jgi:hypothetical protein